MNRREHLKCVARKHKKCVDAEESIRSVTRKTLELECVVKKICGVAEKALEICTE